MRYIAQNTRKSLLKSITTMYGRKRRITQLYYNCRGKARHMKTKFKIKFKNVHH